MKSAIYAAPLLAALAAANPQFGGGPSGGNWGAFSAFPSCASSCRPSDTTNWNGASSLCSDSSTLSNLTSCLGSSSCSDSERSNITETIAQLCVNAGSSITASPYNTYSVTSGGSAWPTAWTTNSAWASAASVWSTAASGASGWNGGAGPFGHGGPGGAGWGAGPWASSGAWTSGPWTSWWGTNGCPASTWSGWTDGTWSTNAPWTSWTACAASTTATSTYTTTTTNTAGSTITSVGTSFGYRVAEASNQLSTATQSTTTSGSGSMPTNFALAGSAAGVFGVLAGALLL